MRKVLYRLMIIIGLCAIPGMTFAQATKVMLRGVVTAAIDKEPLPGVHAMLINNEERVVGTAVTDIDGNYSMNVEIRPGFKLRFSFIGMKHKTIEIKPSQLTYNVTLEEESNVIDEVVVTADKPINTGTMNIRERDLTTSISRILMDDLGDGLAVASVDDALQGQIAGLDIAASTGQPGAAMSMRIRGTTSLTGNNQPLIVVNGFPYETTISDDFDFSTADEEEYSQLLNIAPSDILEISVLKDAAATAIYGSKAANGVLQITTRGGTISKPRVQYTFKGGLTQAPKPIPTLSGGEYTTMIMDALLNSGQLFTPTSRPEFAYDVNQPYYYYNYGADTDWYGAVTQSGHTQDHSVSISGGGQKAQYRVSLGYYDQVGQTINTHLGRITSRINVNYNISSRMKLTSEMAYTRTDNHKNYQDPSRMAFLKMPNMSIWEYNEAGQLTGNYFTPTSTPQGSAYNPVALVEYGLSNTVSNRIDTNLSFQWNPLDWLQYTLGVNMTILNDKNKNFLPQNATGRPWNETAVNQANDGDGESFTLYTLNRLLFRPVMPEHHKFLGLVQFTTEQKRSNGYNVRSTNLASSWLQDPSIPGRVTGEAGLLSSSYGETREIGALGQIQYSFMDRYILAGTARLDASTRFGAHSRYGLFPSVSARWRISGEPFLKKASEKWLDELSLRFSYGVNGNQPKSSFGYISLYKILENNYLGESGAVPQNLELSVLHWERTTQYNAGFNFSAFRGRLSIDGEVYSKRTNDMLYASLPLPSSTGFNSVGLNGGVMDNIGYELSFKLMPYKNKDWTVRFSLNFANNRNYLREIPETYTMEQGSTTSNGSYIRRFELNQSFGSIYGYRYKGVYLNEDQTIARDANGNKIYTYDQYGKRVPVYTLFSYPSIAYQFEAGDAKYEDINHDGNIDYQDVVYLGNVLPILTGGFGPTITYKRWSLNAFFNFRFGNKIMNMTKLNLESMRGMDNQSKSVLKRWRQPYENASEAPADLLPRALYASGYNSLASDRYVEDGSFVRFKTLTLKYTFDQEWLKKTPMTQLNAYVTFNNLHVWTKYSGQDPEVGLGSQPFDGGIDNAYVPRSLTATLGLQVTF